MDTAGCLAFLLSKHRCVKKCETVCEKKRSVYLAAKIILRAFFECSTNLLFDGPMSDQDYKRIFMNTFNETWYLYGLDVVSADYQEGTARYKVMLAGATNIALEAFRADPTFRGWRL
jgi:hypothetical protein